MPNNNKEKNIANNDIKRERDRVKKRQRETCFQNYLTEAV